MAHAEVDTICHSPTRMSNSATKSRRQADIAATHRKNHVIVPQFHSDSETKVLVYKSVRQAMPVSGTVNSVGMN